MSFIQYLNEKYNESMSLEEDEIKLPNEDSDLRWVTVYPHGKYSEEKDENGKRKKNKGFPVLVHSKTGEVQAGMGGKFNGDKITDANKDKEEEDKKKLDGMKSLADADRGFLLKMITQKMQVDPNSAKKMSTARLLKKLRDWREKNR